MTKRPTNGASKSLQHQQIKTMLNYKHAWTSSEVPEGYMAMQSRLFFRHIEKGFKTDATHASAIEVV
jgi:hypothetical protein